MMVDFLQNSYPFIATVFITIGVIYLIASFYVGQRQSVYLLFGFVAISWGVYLVCLAVSTDLYSRTMRVGGFFAGTGYILIPWFNHVYGPWKKKGLVILSSCLFALAVLVYYLGPEKYDPLPWTYLGIPTVLFYHIIGIISGVKLINKEGWRNGILFLLANLIGFIGNLFFGLSQFFRVPSVISDVYEIYIVFFVILITIQLIKDLIQKSVLEKEVSRLEKRWIELRENVELIIIELDKNGIVQYINPFFSRLTGFEKKEVIGKNWLDNFVPAGSKSDLLAFLEKKDQKAIPANYQNPIITKNGREKMIMWSNVTVYDNENKIVGIYSVGTDITEREQALLKIKELKLELEAENIVLKDNLKDISQGQEIIGKSNAIQYIKTKIQQVAPTNSIVLIEGETGVGKDLVAQSIHTNSNRSNYPFIKLNCSNLPKELIESELFGHEKGAFTGATTSKKGRFDLAHKGTLFLDEIGEFPIDLQPKLLRVIESGEYERLGGQKTLKVDVRVISATNRNLEEEIENGTFREDLYYRLNVFPITVPSLRERKGDVPELVHYFVPIIAKSMGKDVSQISKATIKELDNYNWPGNIRELINVLERAVIHSQGPKLKLATSLSAKEKPIDSNTEMQTLEELEKSHIIKTLKITKWKISGDKGAAKILNINASTLRSRMEKFGINRDIQEKY